MPPQTRPEARPNLSIIRPGLSELAWLEPRVIITAIMTLAPRTKLGPYEIVSPLGAGGMGEVYRGHDESLDREVAIKVLPKDLASDQDRLRRFEQEARAAAALNHPNILAVYGFSTTEEHAPYLITELLQGQTLRERLQQGEVPVRKAIEFALQTARGLAAAHDRGIVHRDLKPENLFLTRDGVVKILDFGLAKLVGPGVSGPQGSMATTSVTGLGVVLGTVGYMSPEQVRGQALDHRTDIFSLGAILYEMLSGKRAFQGKTTADTMSAILKEEPAELSRTGHNLPPALARIVHRCLEKDPAERFQSARDLAFNLELLSREESGSGAAVVLAAGKSRRWLIPALVASVALAAVGLTFLARGLRPQANSSPVELMRLTDFVGKNFRRCRPTASRWPSRLTSAEGGKFGYGCCREAHHCKLPVTMPIINTHVGRQIPHR
jgi:serine/threonine protein kinase